MLIIAEYWTVNSEHSMLNNNMNGKRRTANGTLEAIFTLISFIHRALNIEHECLFSVLAGMRIESCEICYMWITNFIFTVFPFLFRIILLFYFSDRKLIIIQGKHSDIFGLTGNIVIFLHLFFSFDSNKKKYCNLRNVFDGVLSNPRRK